MQMKEGSRLKAGPGEGKYEGGAQDAVNVISIQMRLQALCLYRSDLLHSEWGHTCLAVE